MTRRRRTVARHARLRSPHPFRQLLQLVGVAVVVVLVSTLGVAAYTAFDLTTRFATAAVVIENQPAVPPDIAELPGGFSLLLTGTDNCEPELSDVFGARCRGAEAEGDHNDVTMLLHVSDAPRRVTVVSFPRDLIVEIPVCRNADGRRTGGGTDMLNTAYVYGGLDCVQKTITELVGDDITIPFSASVSWSGVVHITDAIGGVDVCVANRIYDPTNTGLDLGPGIHTIAGLEALQFLRTRKGVGDGSDLGRISNQQQYLSRLTKKLASDEVLRNPALLYRLASTALDNITPSESLTNPFTLVQIAQAVKDVPFGDVVFVQYPTYPDSADPNRVRPNVAAASELWDALAANRPLALSGNVGANGGVVAATPGPTGSATASPSASATPGDSPTPTDVATLPPSITGSTAAEDTCSNGNAR